MARSQGVDQARSRQAARELADFIEGGGTPPSIAPPFRMQPGEACYAYRPVRVHQYSAGDAEYLHKTRFMFSPAGLALAAATAAGNHARKARAAKEAAPQWRDLGLGTCS